VFHVSRNAPNSGWGLFRRAGALGESGVGAI